MATAPTPSPAAPSLGYGNRNSASIDQVNQWMRSQPWYTQLFQSWGMTPDSHAALSDDQKQQIIKAAQANGVVVDEGHNGQTVDDTGNFEAKSNLGRNIAIGAGIAGLALTGLGAAGIGPLSGLLAGGTAAEAGGASLAGVEGGAAGLSDASLAALGGATAVPATLGGAAAAAAPLAASATVPAIGALAPGVASGTDAAAAGGALSGAAAGAGGGAGSTLSSMAGLNPTSLAATGIGSAFQYAGAKKQASAATDALNFAKQKQAEQLAAWQPYQAVGQGALANLPAAVRATPGASPTPFAAAPGTVPQGQQTGSPLSQIGQPPPPPTGPPPPPPPTGAPTGQPAAPMVTMQAPDGTQQAVPAAQVQYFLSRGARQVS
jgi:hypothetical protein